MSKRPNILFIMTDQMSARALTADSQCLTPNLDALAADGIRFTRGYTTNAICSPARASLMTGLFPSAHGMWDCTHTQRRQWVDVPTNRFTYFSNVLANAGYRNGYFGKWHVEQSGLLGDFGWHEYDHSIGLMPVQACAEKRVVARQAGYRDFLVAGVDDEAGIPHHPAVDRGIDFIQRHAGTPFCCFVSTLEPHDPFVAPRHFFELYDVEQIDTSPTLFEDPGGKPEVIRRMRSVWREFSTQDWQMLTALYWATISFIDHEVGRILQALKDSGQYDNTIVVFTSDHGEMLGGHGLLTKGVGTAYEEVYNIPLLMRVPGGPSGRAEERAYVSLVDIAPTLLELCGQEMPGSSHGRSICPILEQTADSTDWYDAYGEFFGQRFVYTQRIVWHDTWKYIFSPGGIDELYNLEDDPFERVNLAGDPEHQAVLLSMTRRMWRKMRAIGDESLLNSHYATLRTAPIGPLAADSA